MTVRVLPGRGVAVDHGALLGLVVAPVTTSTDTFVLGAGAVGLWLQWRLQLQGGCTLLARGATLQRLRAEALQVRDASGAELDRLQLQVDDVAVAALPRGATVLIATKADDVGPALDALWGRLPLDATVVLCQNGIGVVEAAAAQYGAWAYGRAGCWMGARREHEDTLVVAGVHRVDLAGQAAARPALALLGQRLRASGIAVDDLGEDIDRAEWRKALWNVAVNALCAVVDGPNGLLLEHPPLRRLAESLLDEALEVAGRDGVTLDGNDRATVWRSLETTRRNINATLQDLRAGRRPELAWLNGAVARGARRQGWQARANEALLDLVEHLHATGARRRDTHS